MQIEKELKQAVKEQRLHSLEAFYFDRQMDLIALEANGITKGPECVKIKKQMEECEKSYAAIESIPVE